MVRMRYKRPVLFLAAFMVLFVLLNYAIWKGYTEDLITDTHFDGGDLTRMAYIRGSKMYRHNRVDLPRRHISLKEYAGQRVDVITIGDSFSQGGGGGLNRYYQDYIASLNNCSVLNLDHYQDVDFISTLSLFLNNGFITQAHPRFVLIGATERGLMRMAQDVDFTKTESVETVRGYKLYPHLSHPPGVRFINNGNFKMLLNALWFRFTDHGLFSNVRVADLEKEMFSVQDGNRLLYLPYKPDFAAADVQRLNENMNMLADRLNAHGIQLIYMPYVDKYTLYCKWLKRKKYPESQFFEMLRPLPKRYRFIDTKALLRGALERGEKDIFYADDTHSTWKASEVIFRAVPLDAPAERVAGVRARQ